MQRDVNGQIRTGNNAFIEPTVVSSVTYRLSEVFVKSGFPNVTFVEREDFVLLKLALEQSGRGVIIEGPSGIGKTTSVEKVVKDLEIRYSHLSMQQVLSARNPIHRNRLQTIREWHNGTVIIDDFHRLDADLRHELVDYLKELVRVHLKPIEHEGTIDLWDDTKIAAGLQWKEAIMNALETACVAVLLVSAQFLASDFIAEHELPKLLDRARTSGTIIIPIILSPSLFTSTKLGAFQAVNDPKHPLTTLSYAKQETILVKVAEAIAGYFRTE